MQVFDLIELIQGLDYSAIFLLTFVSAILIIVPIPYFPVLMTAVLVTDLDPNAIILIGALGAVTAKSIVYMISYYGANIGNLKRNFNEEEYPETFRILKKYGGVAIFLAGITPIPDNIIFIPFGMYRYSRIKFIFITFFSKLLLNTIVVWGTLIIGKPIIGNFSEVSLNMNTLIIAILISVILFSFLFILFLKIRWAVFLESFFVKIKKLRKDKS
ncbi:YqaA family protein [Candidatus Nitrosocosmicus franklandus]|uniref:SNARE associated Golgi protein n=1 Tax=Candidatus Nitrosocosmicus franklandianus TaxID=1798806 RepID=A0A484I9W9_9ARCH|nr:VTT domain-containing protein [Candidatus Nitrosocosmicus franklandus]VFJ14033.1 SNARE associated Golgi protein [Candidatus Nitrosocosmicus franklandus]